jgi:hypothetical protein
MARHYIDTRSLGQVVIPVRRMWLAAALLLLLPIGAWAQTVGTPFGINTTTAGNQRFSTAASDGSGNFVVVWQGAVSGGYGVFGQRYDMNGVRVGTEFAVSALPVDAGSKPSVAVAADGSYFVVAWAVAGVNAGIMARRFDGTGPLDTPEFSVATASTPTTIAPSVAIGHDDFLVAWLNTTSYEWISSRRYDRYGAAFGATEFAVSNFLIVGSGGPAPGQMTDRPVVAADAAGNYMVAWEAYVAPEFRVSARRYDAATATWDPEFVVDHTYFPRQPAIAGGQGSFVIVWERFVAPTPSDPHDPIYAQRVSSTGSLIGSPFRVNTTAPVSGNPSPAVAIDAAGRIAVAWLHNGVTGRSLTADGLPFGGEYVINASSVQDADPGLAATTRGSFVAVWTDPNRDASRGGSQWGIYGQLLKIPADLIVSDLLAPAAVGSGTTVSVSLKVLNQGSVEAPMIVTRVYWSTSPTLGAGAILASQTMGPFVDGEAEATHFPITIPYVAPGTYYLIAVCDDDKAVAEANETNNTLARSIIVDRPDLVVTGLSATVDRSTSPNTVTIRITTQNIGFSTAAPTRTTFFLSSDPVLSPNETPLGVFDVPALSGNGGSLCLRFGPSCSTSQATASFLPSAVSTTPWMMYLIAVSDATNSVAESNEGNNTKVVPIYLW